MCVQCTYVTDGRPAEVESCEHAQFIQYTINNKLARHSMYNYYDAHII